MAYEGNGVSGRPGRYIGNQPALSGQARSVTNITAIAGQTTFTISNGYQPGLIDVFLNGILLAPADYTATNGSTVVLGSAAALDDEFQAIVYQTVGLVDAVKKSGDTMTGALTLPGNPTSNLQAAPKQYVDSAVAGISVPVTSVAGKTGAVTLTNSDVGLGNVENKSSATIRSELTSSNVTTALGYTPYNSTNPNGYTSNTGTVTSVTGTSPVASSGGTTPAISLASGYGDTQNPYASKTANYVLAAPNGTAGVPTFRAIVAADIPTLNQNTTGTASNVTGTVAIANGGTGATTQQAAVNALAGAVTSGQYLRGNGTNIVLSAIQSGDVPTLNQNTTGSAASVSVSGQTGLLTFTGLTSVNRAKTVRDAADTVLELGGSYTPTGTWNWGTATVTWPTFNQNTTGTASNVSGTVAVANGGTGATTNTAARTNLGATTVGSNFFTLTNPSAITFPRINADNTVSALDAATFRGAIGAGTGSGTVTSVTGTSPVASSGGTTPAISLASGYGDTQNPYASKTANQFLAAPNGVAGAPTFRAIVAADIPTLNQNTTGTASNVTGTVAIANGGTGATTAAGALTNLGAYAASNPSGYTSNTGTVTSVAAGAGMSFTSITGSGSVAMGTPSTLTTSTTNSASGTTHTHAVTFPVTSVNGQTGAVTVSAGNASYDATTSSTGYFDLPSGTTAQRPVSPDTGMIRYNTTENAYEVYTTRWRPLSITDYPFTIDYLVVAGGGSGAGSTSGLYETGGGGGGGYRSLTSQSVTSGTNYTVTVGAGGAGSTSGSANGSDSVFFVTTATGGGGGGAGGGTGANGGSGGGGGRSGSGGTGNTPSTSPSQGSNGGAGFNSGSSSAGGGGGGASQVGATATSGTGGKGGNGTANSITGSSVTYAGGGGGGVYSGNTAGAGGTGGGGAGSSTGVGTAGTANTGGGGGGAIGTSTTAGGNGGSGVVIIKYPDTFTITNPGGGLTYSTTTGGGFKVTTFTAGTGTIQFT